MEPRTKKSRQWMLIVAGLVILGALLARSLSQNPEWKAFQWPVFLDSILNVDKGWAAWALVAVYSTYLVRALRWRVIMHHVKPHARLWNLFSATVIGFAAIGLFGRAGEMARPYLVARKEQVSVSGQVAVWLVERWFDTLTLLVTGAFALSTLDAAALRASPALARLFHVGGAIVAAATLASILFLFVMRKYARPLTDWIVARLPHRLARLAPTLRAFEEGTRGVRDIRILILCSLYSLAEWILIAMCYAAVFNAFSGGLRLTLGQTLIFMGCVMAGSMINVPGVGGGIQVASLLVLTELFGLRPELAASISLLIWIFTFLVVIPAAIPLMLYEGLSWAKLRRLPSED